MTIAESFKRFRKEFHLTQKQVAAALGVSQQAYQVYENKTAPTATVLLKLADAFDVSTDYLLGRTDNPKPPSPSTDVSNLDNSDDVSSSPIYKAIQLKLAAQGIQI